MALKSATTTLATIQMRRGREEDFDPDQMTAGEWAVSTDSKKVWMCFAPGLVLRMATYEAFERDMEEIRAILVESKNIQKAIETWYKLAESYAHGGTGAREGEDTDNAKYYADQAKISADNAEAVSGVGIMTVDKAGIGKPDGTTITADEDGTLRVIGGGGASGDFASKEIYGDNAISLGRLEGSTIGQKSIAYGDEVKARGQRSTAIGDRNEASGMNAFVSGSQNIASGNSSSVFGKSNIASENYTFAEGCGNISVGICSHAEGYGNVSGAKYIFKIISYNAEENMFTFDEKYKRFNESYSYLKAGSKLFVPNTYMFGYVDIYTVSSKGSDGKSVTVNENIPTTKYSVAFATVIASNSTRYCHAEGSYSNAIGEYSHAEGNRTLASGDCSHAEGNYTTAGEYQHAQGHYNDTSNATDGVKSGSSSGTAFVIGNGTYATPSNAARIDYNGKLWCKQAYSSTGADYAELFEWADGNPENEDRRGYFVTMDGKKIKKASSGDYIVGVISGNPSVIGNTDMEWYGQFMRDEFGTFLKENYKETVKEPSIDEDGNVTEVEREVDVEFYRVNPDYDPDAPYTFRLDRPEWDAVGMLGVLPVRDDGTCEVGKFCKCADGGIATLATERGFDTYMVIERVTENVVSVVLK